MWQLSVIDMTKVEDDTDRVGEFEVREEVQHCQSLSHKMRANCENILAAVL